MKDTKFIRLTTAFICVVTMLLMQTNLIGQVVERNLSGSMNFDIDWHFALGDNQGASRNDFVDKNWRLLDLPHDWSIESRIDSNNVTGNAGGYFSDGVGWYRKTFNVPVSWKGKLLYIDFGGVYMNAEVFINGHSLGIHHYGYTAFRYELTPYIHYGADNLIAVRVDNSKQINCRWYSGSGIYRHVELRLTDSVHIDPWDVYITTPEIRPDIARVQVSTSINNAGNSKRQISIQTEVFDKTAKKSGSVTRKVILAPHSVQTLVQEVLVPRPQLWDLATPNMYTAKITVKQRNTVLQQMTKRFGIRSIKFTAERGFELNGKVIKLNGGCMHHDNGCLGAAAYDRAEVRKVELLKGAGFNAVRTAHNPPSIAFLAACDDLGILVIDEAFDGWRTQKNPYDYSLYFDSCWKMDLDAMVLRDRNHPSIIMWSIGNEVIERKESQAVITARSLTDEVKLKDPTRPVTSAMTTWDNDWDIFDPLMAVHDVAGYNYQLQRAGSDHKRVPSRIIVQTESFPNDAFKNWLLVQNNHYIIGDFVWTAMDYLGESGIGRYYYPGEPKGEHWERPLFPWHGAYCGDINLMGERKPISYYRSLLYNKQEKLYLAVREPNPASGKIQQTMWSVWPTWESWTWPGHENKMMEVEIYSRYPSIRLYLNDQLIGERVSNEATEFKAVFKVPYKQGILRAVGVRKGREEDSQELRTAGKTTQIRLKADRSVIKANGQDLSYITINLVDSSGTVQPEGSNRLFFALQGPGVIAGVDNGNLQDADPYMANSRLAWKGKALVVIKSTKEKGKIQLTVHAEGLPDQTIQINAQ